jgi:hypothetical protein
LAGPVPGSTWIPPLILPADRLRRLWRAVEVSVVALEQSGIVPAAGNGEGGNVFFRRCGQYGRCQSLQRPCPSSKARWGKKQKRRRKTCQRLSKPNLRKTYDLRLRSSGTANPRHKSVKEPGSGTVVLPAVMIRAKSPGTEKLLFRNAISAEKVAVSPDS